MIGTVKHLEATKYFGFITGEDGQSYFMHKSALVQGLEFSTLAKGEKVSFDPEEGQKGPRAANVERA